MEEFRKTLKELGDAIEHAHYFGNNHEDREEQLKLFKKLEEMINQHFEK